MMRWLKKSTLLLLLFVTQVVTDKEALATEQGLPQEVTINGIELVYIPAGWFWYSVNLETLFLPDGEPKYRNIRIWLDGFYLAKYEAKAEDLVRFLNSGEANSDTLEKLSKLKKQFELNKGVKRPLCTIKQSTNGHWQENFPEENMPATDLSWTLAKEFATWLGLRLPSEFEWQKGARGGNEQRDWPWGNTFPDDTFAHIGWHLMRCDPKPVDAYPKGRSPYGLYNMAGNVGEFVEDWFNQEYDKMLTDGLRNPSLASEGTDMPHYGTLKISKGGLWTQGAKGNRIIKRRLRNKDRARSRNGVRFAADTATVLRYLASEEKLPDQRSTHER